MKISSILLITFLSFISCNKENPELDINLIPSTLTPDSGEFVDFKIEGSCEFLVFYSGQIGQEYENYPNSVALGVNTLAKDPSFSFRYNYHGPIKGVFVATSYGNWGEDSIEKIFEFDFNVTDNNTDIVNVTLKKGIFGDENVGVIDAVNKTITITLETGSSLSGYSVNVLAGSSKSEIWLGGIPFVNKSVLDFSSGSKTFTVKAIGGKETDWTVEVFN